MCRVFRERRETRVTEEKSVQQVRKERKERLDLLDQLVSREDKAFLARAAFKAYQAQLGRQVQPVRRVIQAQPDLLDRRA